MAEALLLIGCGNMGSSLLRGWCSDEALPGPFVVVTPNKERVVPFLDDPRVQYFTHPSQIENAPQMIVCALKPAMIESVLPLYRDFMKDGSIFLTVVAALPLTFYRRVLGDEATLVRVMPNLPVAAGVGQSLYCGLTILSPHVRRQIEKVFGGLGKAIFVPDEEALDQRTPLVGCGPGFLFKVIEAFARASQNLGVETHEANALSREMFIATAKFLEKSPKEVSTLAQEVASPHGMTEAGYNVMEARQLGALVQEAFLAAFRRARAMEEEYTHAR